jgi:hypothetical protein
MLSRGFTLVNTPRFFDDEPLFRQKRCNVVLNSNCTRWWKFPQLARYGRWLERLLREALAEESLCLKALEFRHERAGLEIMEIDRLHADGSYLRSVWTLYGPPTVYRDGKMERPAPSGHTLLLTALDRARALRLPCTLHRRPRAGTDRAVIVCSFEPRREGAQPQ